MIPCLFWKNTLKNARVLHIHGIAQRDHQSLQYVPAQELRRIMDFLVSVNYEGVLTMEVFGEDDFHSSCSVLLESLHQMNLEAQWGKSFDFNPGRRAQRKIELCPEINGRKRQTGVVRGYCYRGR